MTVPDGRKSSLDDDRYYGFHGLTNLTWACQSGDLIAVEALLDKGVSVEAMDESGTPLIRGVEGQNIAVVKLLLEKGANVNSRDIFFKSPLHVAAAHGNMSILKLLIENGADVAAQDDKYDTPLHKACQNNKLEAVQYLFEKSFKIETMFISGNINPDSEAAKFLQKRGVKLVKYGSHERSCYETARTDQDEYLPLLLRSC